MGLEDDYDDVVQGNRSSAEIPVAESTQAYFPLFPMGLPILLVTTLGITGNLLSSYVLTRKKLRSSSYSVLTLFLTLVDTVYLATKLVRFGLLSLFSHFQVFYQYTNVFLPIFGPYLRPLTFTAHTASTYLTMTIAFDRYLVISRPRTARHYCTTRNSRIISILIITFAIIYNIPRWFEYYTRTYKEEDGDEDVMRYEMVISELRMNGEYRRFYIFWAYVITMFVIPVVMLTIINFLIWKGLNHIEKSGLVLTSTQSRDTSFSAMLVGVVVVFLICNLDYLVLDLLDYFGIPYPTLWNHVGNFLLTLNSAVNFLIYCLCGRKFRDELRSIFEKWGWLHCLCLRGGRGAGTQQSQDIFTTTGVWIKDIPRRNKNNGVGRFGRRRGDT